MVDSKGVDEGDLFLGDLKFVALLDPEDEEEDPLECVDDDCCGCGCSLEEDLEDESPPLLLPRPNFDFNNFILSPLYILCLLRCLRPFNYRISYCFCFACWASLINNAIVWRV